MQQEVRRLIDMIREARAILDEELPLESSVAKDQMVGLVLTMLVQREIAREMAPWRKPEPMPGVMVFGQMAAQLTLAKASATADEDEIWPVFSRFLDKLEYLAKRPDLPRF